MDSSEFTPAQLSNEFSSKTVPDSLWFSEDAQAGAGVVIIQPSTDKVLLISFMLNHEPDGSIIDPPILTYMLPGGRKDLGETVEECALREAYEESGYRCTFLPLNVPTHVPIIKDQIRYPNVEPFAYTIWHWRSAPTDPKYAHTRGTECIRFWYIAQISEDAVREYGTHAEGEDDYNTHLVSFEEAEKLLVAQPRFRAGPLHLKIFQKARKLWESR